MAISDYVTQGMYSSATTPQQSLYNPATLQSPDSVVQGSLESMMNPQSSYIQNARQRGVEQAATRGGINSSIAAGASERAAIEAAAPLAQQAVNIQQNREATLADEWASQNNFNRAMIGQYSQSAFNSSLDMLNMIQQFSLNDPELYTPEVMSGYSNFFNQNMNDILGRYIRG